MSLAVSDLATRLEGLSRADFVNTALKVIHTDCRFDLTTPLDRWQFFCRLTEHFLTDDVASFHRQVMSVALFALYRYIPVDENARDADAPSSESEDTRASREKRSRSEDENMSSLSLQSEARKIPRRVARDQVNHSNDSNYDGSSQENCSSEALSLLDGELLSETTSAPVNLRKRANSAQECDQDADWERKTARMALDDDEPTDNAGDSLEEESSSSLSTATELVEELEERFILFCPEQLQQELSQVETFQSSEIGVE